MILPTPFRDWYCPNCGATDRTQEYRPRFHTCPKLRGLTAPMLPVGAKARVYLREREDYVGSERVQVDPELGRPVMSIVTERDDGSNDAIILAPTATAAARN